MFKVNNGNSKLGKSIKVINLPAGITCRCDAPCNAKNLCYAKKGSFMFPSVKNCYAENLKSFITSPTQAKEDILSQLSCRGYVRIHASGDIPNLEYLEMLVDIAITLPATHFMAYTKKYNLINAYVSTGGVIPANLTIIFSLWDDYKCSNPFVFPTSQVVLKGGNIDPIQEGFMCTGNCENCYKCWELQKGDNVLFNQH